jgi:cell division septation protein DedD
VKYPSVSFVVLLGVFRARRDAERLAAEAKARRVRTYVDSVTRSPTKYRVLVGPYERRSQAVEAAETLRKRGFRGVVLELKPRADQPA